jgi:ribosomal protein S18 acetylase RimI-like enzyme
MTEFRRAQAGDIERLLPLVREFYQHERIPFEEAVSRHAFAELIGTPSLGSVWLIQSTDALLGYFALTHGFILEFGGRHAFLDEFYLRPEFRGQGHGQAALRQAEEICREEKIGVLRLEVDVANVRGQRLYLRAGFTLHERYTMTKVITGV